MTRSVLLNVFVLVTAVVILYSHSVVVCFALLLDVRMVAGLFKLDYRVLYHTIPYYTILYYTILYYTILYYTILYYTILYYTILYYTILYHTMGFGLRLHICRAWAL